MKTALIFYGGWDGHEPELVANRFARLLVQNGIAARVCAGTDCLEDQEELLKYDLIVPIMTISDISDQRVWNVAYAVSRGVGLAGCHGGMCDAFRGSPMWQFMTGGQWVSHPGGDGIDYTVNICHGANPITEGLEDFPVCTEHYYLHIDPAVEVLATTRFPLVNYFHAANKPVDMPVAWTKFWGLGRVFYCSLGHHDDVFDKAPSAQVLMERGMLWAAEGKAYAAAHGLDPAKFDNSAKMF